MDKAALGQVLPRVLWFPLPPQYHSTIAPYSFIHSSFPHRQHIIGSVVNRYYRNATQFSLSLSLSLSLLFHNSKRHVIRVDTAEKPETLIRMVNKFWLFFFAYEKKCPSLYRFWEAEHEKCPWKCLIGYSSQEKLTDLFWTPYTLYPLWLSHSHKKQQDLVYPCCSLSNTATSFKSPPSLHWYVL